MRSVLVKEQKPYTREEILAFFDGDGVTALRKLKECGVIKTVRADRAFEDLSKLSAEDYAVLDEADTHTERRYVFSFVGVLVVHGTVIRAYPKYVTDDYSDETLAQVFRVLERYSRTKEEILRISVTGENAQSFNRLAALLFFLNEYYENGIYENTEQTMEINGMGEIDWSRTVSEAYALLCDGRPYYAELKTHRRKTDERDYFTRLHACILTLCSRELSDASLLSLLGIPETELSEEALSDFGDLSYILYRLQRELDTHFDTRRQTLLRMMILFLSDEGTLLDSCALGLYGTNAYYAVWEEVCSRVAGNQRDLPIARLSLPCDTEGRLAYLRAHGKESLVQLIDRPRWFDRMGDPVLQKCDTLLPDILTVNEDAFYLFDAKYYAFSLTEAGVFGQPGVADLTKQYLYQHAFRPFCRLFGYYGKRIKNCFLFPCESGDAPRVVGSVRMDMFSRLGLKNVRAILLPAPLMYEAYLAGRTLLLYPVKRAKP